jgi:hypothetical protein
MPRDFWPGEKESLRTSSAPKRSEAPTGIQAPDGPKPSSWGWFGGITRRLQSKESDDYWAAFNLLRALVWVGVIPVAYFWGWVYSVAFVAVCSLYANVASDFAAWRADRNPRIERKLDEIERKLNLLLGSRSE